MEDKRTPLEKFFLPSPEEEAIIAAMDFMWKELPESFKGINHYIIFGIPSESI